ncbi:hypothetical protein CDAR_33541 [Caerostris darwini]|uniref:Uncharacterized protein n=1 Tax=Caerostris darwini TaxID=1538125 RepID=A0AAV4QKU7_9ARAC|nr:hypothetical protein CDAR_33541 [Caerostris darwini]
MESAVETPVQSLGTKLSFIEDDIHLHSVFKGTIHSSLSSIDRLVERRGKGVFHEVSPAHSSVRTRDAHAYTSIGALSVKLSSSDGDRNTPHFLFDTNKLTFIAFCVFFSEAQQDPTNPKRYPGSRVNSSSTLPPSPSNGRKMLPASTYRRASDRDHRDTASERCVTHGLIIFSDTQLTAEQQKLQQTH